MRTPFLALIGFASFSLSLPGNLSLQISPETDPGTDETLQLTWQTGAGFLYTLQVSSDLNGWVPVEGYPVEGEGGPMQHAFSPGTDRLFFLLTESEPPLPLLNRQSGISLALSGINGVDWAVEHSFHDAAITDQVIYLKSDVELSLSHNANNTIMNRTVGLPAVLGTTGLDGIEENGDEGDIYWKIDRDLQNHRYSTKSGASMPDFTPLYEAPFTFASLTYDGVLPVLGSTGDNGLPWGSSPKGSTGRFAYGQLDAFGNEWHTLTYWDDDEPLYTAQGKNSHRQGASDGHWVYLCVNPVTPVLQLRAPNSADQFYTTPIKTYHIPKTWEQTSYLTDGVELGFLNLTDNAPVQYRVNGGTWQTYDGNPLVAGALGLADNTPSVLEYRNGASGPVASRTLVLNPSVPGAGEVHGYMLWADDDERATVVDKLDNVQPFARSYSLFKGDTYQSLDTIYTDARGGWRSGAGMASTSLSNAFLANIEGIDGGGLSAAAMAKERLLRLARLEPVGFEQDINSATPSKDYMNELSQTMQQFADAGVAYDLLAACYRSTDHPGGMTPIEELRIRDGLAEVAKTTLQVRANNSFSIGGGDTHWAHGYEQMIGTIALAMPTYKTPYFGVSGADFVSVNDLSDGDGKYWNPFPDQAVTWYEAATDPAIATPGHPNVKAPIRSEALLTDDGWWVGPNDYEGDGDRYFSGPTGRRLVDLQYTGMANAECRVELVEMSGYEAAFPERTGVFDYIRRIRGDNNRQPSVTSYIRRRLMNGHTPLAWDSVNKVYTAVGSRAVTAIYAFNNHYEAASLPSAQALMEDFLFGLNQYYGYESGSPPDYINSDRAALYNAYALALFWDPDSILPHQPEANHAPSIKPLLKHVVHAGEQIHKDLIIMDPDDDPLTVQVTGLPAGASFDPVNRVISWVPGVSDEGVHIATVTADDGIDTSTAYFPMIVKSDAPAGPVPSSPGGVTASLSGNDVTVTWTAPSGVTVAAYIVWRDGIPATVLPAGTTSWTDYGLLPSTLTRYHVSVLAGHGSESGASEASPGYIFVP